jgi:hypothetical protein
LNPPAAGTEREQRDWDQDVAPAERQHGEQGRVGEEIPGGERKAFKVPAKSLASSRRVRASLRHATLRVDFEGAGKIQINQGLGWWAL